MSGCSVTAALLHETRRGAPPNCEGLTLAVGGTRHGLRAEAVTIRPRDPAGSGRRARLQRPAVARNRFCCGAVCLGARLGAVALLELLAAAAPARVVAADRLVTAPDDRARIAAVAAPAA